MSILKKKKKNKYFTCNRSDNSYEPLLPITFNSILPTYSLSSKLDKSSSSSIFWIASPWTSALNNVVKDSVSPVFMNAETRRFWGTVTVYFARNEEAEI